MAITTTDVVTNVVSGVETIKNGSSVVYCWPGVPMGGSGNYQVATNSFEYEKSYSYTAIENKSKNRFDDVTYFFNGSGHPNN